MAKKIQEVKFFVMPGGEAPTQGTERSAGWDIYAREDYLLKDNEMVLVDTGIIAQAPKGFHFKLCVRSGICIKRGLVLANGVGIIDEDYAGPGDRIMAPLFKLPVRWRNVGPNKPKGLMNLRHEAFKAPGEGGRPQPRDNWYIRYDTKPALIRRGERVGQLLIEETVPVRWELQNTNQFAEDRGGFGSTGE